MRLRGLFKEEAGKRAGGWRLEAAGCWLLAAPKSSTVQRYFHNSLAVTRLVRAIKGGWCGRWRVEGGGWIGWGMKTETSNSIERPSNEGFDSSPARWSELCRDLCQTS
jgi:hypothetical protein